MTTSGFILGFDPGGENAFGWSVCKFDGDETAFLRAGVANDHQEARCAVEKKLCQLREQYGNLEVLGAGIDAPLLWSKKRHRNIECLIREELGKTTFQGDVNKTVQHVNSLRGACTVQGVLLATRLHDEYPKAKITEAHPRALRYLLRHRDAHLQLEELLSDLKEGRKNASTKAKCERFNHKLDATTAAYAAWASHREPDGWSNLYCLEPDLEQPFCTPDIEYWMPIQL